MFKLSSNIYIYAYTTSIIILVNLHGPQQLYRVEANLL